MMRAQGYTLIGLVAAIIIISIVAMVAVPLLFSVRIDAKNATLESVRREIESQVAIVHARLAAADLIGRNPNRTDPATGGGYYGFEPEHNPFRNICGEDCYFIYGTPSASATTISSIMSGIGNDQDIVFSGYHANNWESEGVTGTDIVGTFSFRDNAIIKPKPGQNALKSDNCFIWYSGAREDRSYKIGIVPCL